MNIAVIGEGGHSKVIQDLIHLRKDITIKAILDDKYEELFATDDGYRGPVSSAHSLLEQFNELKFVVAIGNNKIRKSIVSRLALPDDSYISLIHESAVVSPRAMIGPGTVVMPNAVINADVIIGKHSIVNTGAIIEHDDVLGQYVHVSPKATLTGAVRVEEGAMIGAGATVIPARWIGEWSVVGAGATVISHIPPYSTAVGTPAKVIKTGTLPESLDPVLQLQHIIS